MYKELEKNRNKLAKQMGLRGETKPGMLMDRMEAIKSGIVKMNKPVRNPHLKKAEMHLMKAEKHLQLHSVHTKGK